ncbi:hypothetical protein V6N13_022112 [Hibiscus sabdariffa]
MAELKALYVSAFDWLKGNDPAQWSKSHFSPRSKCDMLLSNLSECFNKMILEARDKPILTLMEMVGTKMMQKIAMKKEEAEKWTGILCPKIQQKVELAIQQCTRCWPTHARGHKYQVSAGPLNQYTIDLEHHTCSCRKWDITGITCIHVVSVMILRNERPESYVHACYKTTTLQHIYNHFIEPVRGPNQWLHDTTCESVIEPKFKRPPGRPKKQRVKEADEAKKSGAKWTKKGLVMYYSKCKKPGHNQRTYKGEIGANRPVRKPRVAFARPPLRTPKLQSHHHKSCTWGHWRIKPTKISTSMMHQTAMVLAAKEPPSRIVIQHEVLNCAENPHPHNRNALGSSIPSCQLLILDVSLLPFASICSRQRKLLFYFKY